MRYSPISNNHCTHLHLGGLKGQPAISPGLSDEGASPRVNKPHGLSPYRGKSKKKTELRYYYVAFALTERSIRGIHRPRVTLLRRSALGY